MLLRCKMIERDRLQRLAVGFLPSTAHPYYLSGPCIIRYSLYQWCGDWSVNPITHISVVMWLWTYWTLSANLLYALAVFWLNTNIVI